AVGSRAHRVSDLGPIQDIGEFRANLEVHAFLEAEVPADVEALRGMASGAEVIVVQGCRTRAPGAGSRVGPGSRVQHLVRIRIDTPAIEVLKKQGLARAEHLTPGKIVCDRGAGRR